MRSIGARIWNALKTCRPAVVAGCHRQHALAVLLSIVVAATVVIAHRQQVERRVDTCAEVWSRINVLIERVEAVDATGRFRQVTARTDATSREVAIRRPAGRIRANCVLKPDLRLRLSWPVTEGSPAEGERWSIEARVREPRGFVNPGAFDYERWLFSEGIAGTGQVRAAEAEPVSGSIDTAWHATRDAIREALIGESSRSTPESSRRADFPFKRGGVLLALVLADGSQVTEAQWQLFRATGTIHLIIVSGLHIVIVAMLAGVPGWLLGRALLARFPGMRVRYLTFAAAISGAAGYTALTGFEVPAVRAVIMFALGSLPLLAARRIPSPVIFAFALAFTSLAMPLSVLASGFWLSFAAVAALIVTEHAIWRAPARYSALWRFVRSQWFLSIALIGWLLLLVGSVSVTAPFANLLVVPLVSVIVLPVALLGCLALPINPVLASGLLAIADVVLGWVMALLEPLRHVQALPGGELDPLLFMALVLAGLLILLPLPWRFRALLIPVLLLPLVPTGSRMREGEFEIRVLDVGQGSATLVSTRHSSLVFDAGPRYPSGFDTGEAVVMPALATLPVRRPDALIITHEDIDHAGGARVVSNSFRGLLTLSGEERTRSSSCHDFPSWRRDGVSFRLLSADAIRGSRGSNDRSCALLIDNHRSAVLLTGDTGASLETMLLRDLDDQARERLAVVLVPHHGSNSSSSRSFVRLTTPAFALVSAGYLNRYGHPHPDVRARWQQAGARVLTTGESGALVWRSDRPGQVVRLREASPRYWRGRAST